MANNILIKDGGGVNVTVKTTEDLGPPVVHTPHHIVDSIVAALPIGANAIGSVALSATDNAVLDEIVVNTGTNATEAKQDVIIGHVDGIEALLGTSNANTGASATAANQVLANTDLAAIEALLITAATDSAIDNAVLDTIDADTSALFGCVDGSELKVDVKDVTLPTAGIMGTQTYAGGGAAQVALRASATLKSGVTVKALSTNAAAIHVGFTGVTATTSGATTTGGIELAAKESVFIEIDDPAKVFIIAGAAGVVTYIGS